MSSRVIRANDSPSTHAGAGQAAHDATLDVQPILWRRAGGAPPSQARPANQTANDHGPSPDQMAAMEQQMQQRVAAAKEQGRAEGEAAAQQRAMDVVNPVVASFQSLIADLSGQGHRLRHEAERDTVKLAVAIARRILHREIAVDPEAVLGLVKAAFSKVEARETHRLRVCATDAALLQQRREQLNLPHALEIVADGSLQAGSAIFETSRGELDASIDTQLAEIDRGLADVVRRRIK
jgi:flagellar assembly protein FliH